MFIRDLVHKVKNLFKDEDSRLFWEEVSYIDKKKPYTQTKVETNQTQIYLEYIDRNPLIKHHNKRRVVGAIAFFTWLFSINVLWNAQGYEEATEEATVDKFEREALETVVNVKRVNKQDFEMYRQIKPTNKYE
eukprot:gene1628-12753_t